MAASDLSGIVLGANLAQTFTDLSQSGDHYNTAHNLYNRESQRVRRLCEWIDGSLPELANSIEVSLSRNEQLKVLSVGPGNGEADSKILSHLLDKKHPNIRAVIVEPDGTEMQQYRHLVSTDTMKLQGVDFQWTQQTFQDYQIGPQPGDKFQFISCLNAIYYLGDINWSLKSLYDRLDKGGVLVLILMRGESGFGRLWKHLHKTCDKKGGYLTSTDVEDACKKHNIPISEIQTIPIACDITSCFAPPKELSQDGRLLLDFLTHTADFTGTAPPEYRDEVLTLLGSEACSRRGPAGEVIFKGDNVAVVIRK